MATITLRTPSGPPTVIDTTCGIITVIVVCRQFRYSHLIRLEYPRARHDDVPSANLCEETSRGVPTGSPLRGFDVYLKWDLRGLSQNWGVEFQRILDGGTANNFGSGVH